MVVLSLQFGPNELERVSSYRYLRVIITDNLTWDEHISHMCAKARQLIGLFFSALCKISHTNCSYKALQSIGSSSPRVLSVRLGFLYHQTETTD